MSEQQHADNPATGEEKHTKGRLCEENEQMDKDVQKNKEMYLALADDE